jgi:hypothetical protein
VTAYSELTADQARTLITNFVQSNAELSESAAAELEQIKLELENEEIDG